MAVEIGYNGIGVATLAATGSVTLATSGKYCRGNVVVAYTPRSRTYELTLTKSSGWVLLTELDADVLAHINDPTLTVVLAINDDYEMVNYSGSLFIASNTPIGYSGGTSGYPIYGIANRQVSSYHQAQPIYYQPGYTGTSTDLGGLGAFRVSGTKYYVQPGDGYLRAGNYRLIFTW
ncbi:MAG: hypothetical protein IKW50_02035 [Oscillospiraceae bacterium]|nr:hypothetical protein [Oscillospiraceae bacterium]